MICMDAAWPRLFIVAIPRPSSKDYVALFSRLYIVMQHRWAPSSSMKIDRGKLRLHLPRYPHHEALGDLQKSWRGLGHLYHQQKRVNKGQERHIRLAGRFRGIGLLRYEQAGTHVPLQQVHPWVPSWQADLHYVWNHSGTETNHSMLPCNQKKLTPEYIHLLDALEQPSAW